MLENIFFYSQEIESLIGFLSCRFSKSDVSAEKFVQKLLKAAEENTDFKRVLRQWCNHAKWIDDLNVNGFSLLAMTNLYFSDADPPRQQREDKKYGILICLYQLWLEKTSCPGICRFNTKVGWADWRMMESEGEAAICRKAVRLTGGDWCFFHDTAQNFTSEYCSPYDFWNILERNPLLTSALSEEFPEGTELHLNAKGTGYDVRIPGRNIKFH